MSSIGCNFNQSSILVANQLYKVKHKYLDSFCFSVVFMSNKNQDALKQNNIGKCSIAVIVKNNLESSKPYIPELIVLTIISFKIMVYTNKIRNYIKLVNISELV